jgi:hypothetical protein
MDSRADRAIIVRLVRGMLNGILLGRGRLGRRYAGDGGAACELFEMDVSERKDKLQRHRCKREPTPAPLSGPSPTHWQNASTPAWDSLQRSRSRANTFRSKTLLASINWLDCCPNVTGRCRPTCAVSSTFCQRTTPFAISFATYQRGPRRAGECPRWVCAVTRRCFPQWVQVPRRTLQPEATRAAMEVTK